MDASTLIRSLATFAFLLVSSTAAAQPWCIESDEPDYVFPSGETRDVLEHGWRMFGYTTATHTHPNDGSRPIQWPQSEIMSWERFGPGVLRFGGQRGFMHDGTQVVQFDASWKTVWLLEGRAVMKLEDHPTLNGVGGSLLHLTEVADVHFGNVNRKPVTLAYQGAAGGENGYPFTIQGQGAQGLTGQSEISGGDLILRAGSANPATGESTIATPGNLLISGGFTGDEATGNIAIGNEPSDWADAKGAVFIDDVQQAPSFAVGGGGFLFSQGGALYWQGSAGTVTQIAAP